MNPPTNTQYVIRVEGTVFPGPAYFAGHVPTPDGQALTEFVSDVSQAQKFDSARECNLASRCECMASFARTIVVLNNGKVTSKLAMEVIDEAVTRTDGIDQEAIKALIGTIEELCGLNNQDPEYDPRAGLAVAGSILANALCYFAAQATACNGHGHAYIREIAAAAGDLTNKLVASTLVKHVIAEAKKSHKDEGAAQ